MPAAHPLQTRTVPSFDGTDLSVHTTDGAKGLPWIALLSSPSASSPVWRPQLSYLATRFRFVTWDYRGLYRSRRPRDPGAYTPRDQLRDVTAVLDAVGVPRCAVVSFSLGATLALDFAGQNPGRVTHLSLLSPVLPRAYAAALGLPPSRALVPALLDLVRRSYPAIAHVQRRAGLWPETAGWLKRSGLASDTLDDEVLAEMAEAFKTVDIVAYRRTLAELEKNRDAPSLEALRMPALVVAGQRDQVGSVLDARRLVRRLPFGELFLVKDGTHYTPLEFPELVNLRIEKFLDAHPVTPP